MWPPLVDAVGQTGDAEAFIEDLYAEALRRWAPAAAAAVLPTFEASVSTTAELPPNPDGIVAAQTAWEAELGDVLEGVAAVWDDAAAATAAALDSAGLADALTESRDDYIDAYRLVAFAVPGVLRDELTKLIAEQQAVLTASVTSELRGTVRKALSAGSEVLRKIARRLGYHGAGVLNHAAMTVAKHAGGSDRLYWRSRRDDKVRPTHRIADGQIVPLGSNFLVGGAEMAFPGDPRGPARELFGCRCRLIVLAMGEDPPAPWDGGIKPIAASASEETETMTAPIVAATEVAGSFAAPEAEFERQSADLLEVVAEEVPHGAEQTPAETYRTFTDAVVAFIGTPTSDYRRLAKDIDLSFRATPLALTWQRNTGAGHDGAATVGVIESLRAEDDKVFASGYLLNSSDADEAAIQIEHGVTRPSIAMGADKWHLTTEDGEEFTDEMWFALPLTDQRGGQPYREWTAAEIIGTTLVATPAFGDTYLRLDNEPATREAVDSLVAALHPVAPRVWPAGHFADPHLCGPTYPTLTDDGRVYGHMACWGVRHRSIQNEWVEAPHSPSDYMHFHTSPAVRLDDDTRLPVGRLTVATGHADKDLRGIPAQAHYDNTGTCWALVRAGEDAHGIWFSGVPAPWATPEQIEAGLAAPLSGDWRDFGEGLDLIAALSVNTPALPIGGRSDKYGRPVALVAALGPGPGATGRRELTLDGIKTAVAEAMAEQIAAQRFETERAAAAAAAAVLKQERETALAAAAELTTPLSPRDEIALMLQKVGL